MGYIFSFLVYKTLTPIVKLFFSSSLQSCFSNGKFIPSQLYILIKTLIFVIFSECYPISLWFNVFFYNFIWFIINHDFYVITFWMHYMLFIIVFRRNKLIAIDNWIFHVSKILQLILQLIIFCFCHHYFYIQYNYWSKNHLLFLVYSNSLLLHKQNIILYL